MSLLAQIGDLTPSIGLARQVGQLFFPREYKLLSEDSEISIDTVLSESHESTISVTNHAVEQGADMSDHFVVNPLILNLTCVISDVSSNEFIDFGLIGQVGKAIGDSVTGTKSNIAWEELKYLQQSGELISYESNLELYENMLITDLRVAQDNSTSKAIHFTMTLKQVLIAELETIDGEGVYSIADDSKGNPSTKDKMGKVAEKGKKLGSDVLDSSLLYKGLIG